MLSYEKLRGKPSAFASLTGLSLPLFETLLADFEAALAQQRQNSTVTKRHRTPRRRAIGAGHPFSQTPATQLVMTLFWLRTYPTFEVLGLLFDLAKSNANLNVHATLAMLESLTTFTFERPAKERAKLHSVQAVMDAFPDVRLVIDATEQRIRRPKSSKDNDQQKPYYSGKKKAHTLKTQVGVDPGGRFEAVSDSVPGSVHDLTLLRRSKLLDQLAAEEEAIDGAMLDSGYNGIRKDYPDQPLHHPHKAGRGQPLSDEQKAFNQHLARSRIVVEHSLAQFKQFQAVTQVFRQRRERHTRVVRVVAGLVNRRIAECPLKRYPN